MTPHPKESWRDEFDKKFYRSLASDLSSDKIRREKIKAFIQTEKDRSFREGQQSGWEAGAINGRERGYEEALEFCQKNPAKFTALVMNGAYHRGVKETCEKAFSKDSNNNQKKFYDEIERELLR